MLRTFPKRKQVFVPQAVCKTTVPETFAVLLSQRRRWINSTIHNLMELVLVRDLCGTFCFSMQFVVGVDLVGTLVLPAAIAFTFYVGKSTLLRPFPATCWQCPSHYINYPEASPNHSTCTSRLDPWSPGRSHRPYCSQVVICCLDGNIPAVSSDLEFRSPSLCILEVWWFLMGWHSKDC